MFDQCKKRASTCVVLTLAASVISSCSSVLPHLRSSGYEDAALDLETIQDDGQWQAVGGYQSGHHLHSIYLTDILFADDSTTLETLSAKRGEAQKLKNIDALGHSNYKATLLNSHVIEETFVSFADDSTTLNQKERQEISRLVARSDPSLLYRVVANSHGATRIHNGNEALAQRRAIRVIQQLVAAGVPASNVLPEGCWSHNPAKPGHPDRGVLVTTLQAN